MGAGFEHHKKKKKKLKRGGGGRGEGRGKNRWVVLDDILLRRTNLRWPWGPGAPGTFGSEGRHELQHVRQEGLLWAQVAAPWRNETRNAAERARHVRSGTARKNGPFQSFPF